MTDWVLDESQEETEQRLSQEYLNHQKNLELEKETEQPEQPTPAPIEPSIENTVEERTPENYQEYKSPPNILDKTMEMAMEPKNALTDFQDIIKPAALGVGDFIADGMGLVPWLKPVDQWWDDNTPKSKTPMHSLIRDTSAIVIPTLVGGKLIVGGLASATSARHIPTATRTLGSILAAAGVETSVAAISSQSYEQDNAAGALNKMFGWNLPWTTLDSDSPELRRKKHIYEAAGLSVGVDFMLSLGRFVKAIQRVNLDQQAIQMAEESTSKLREVISPENADPITDGVAKGRIAREEALENEALKRYKADPEGTDYDPFINEPATPESRAVTDLEVDPVGAKEDLWRIQNNSGTVDGQMRPSADKNLLDYVGDVNTNSVERSEALGNFFDYNLSANADSIINGKKISADKLNESVDHLTNAIFNPDIGLNDFEEIVEKGKTLVFQGRKFLNEEDWVKASMAWEESFKAMFDPDNMRSSAMITQQAGDSITSTAKAMSLIEETSDVSRQWEIVSEKMKLLAGEVKANEYIANRVGELKQLVKGGDHHFIQEWLQDQPDLFDDALLQSKQRAGAVIDELEKIGKYHPSYLKPFKEAYDATNGNVDTLYKLHKWAEHNIGLIKKGIYDRHPEMPSFIIKGLNGIRYNSMLAGLAPARAVTGNLILSAIKPISVFAGASATGDVATFKRAMWTFGGLTENFRRGYKVLGDEWRLANSNPEVAAARGRIDVRGPDMDKFDTMETMSEAWRKDGKTGKLAMWNIAKGMTHWNDSKYARYGINAMYAIDGFTNSLMASGSSRAKAYDQLFAKTNGSFLKEDFQDLQRHLYSEAFDRNGVLTDKAAKFASQEIALNLDSGLVNNVESIINRVPAARALFMFPRTGINALELSWSFNPISNLGPAITKARRVFTAETTDEIAEILSEHGLDYSDEAYRALRSEYIGRQVQGSAVITGVGLWALEGNVTGSGPQDGAERKRMMDMGWEPFSIKNPITGEWRSYQGLEPFAQVMGLTADMVYQANRVDESISEEWFRKLLHSISMNITNTTFLSGFEPLVSMMSGEEGAWNRFWAMQADTWAPYAGVRSILSNAISPQVKDVEKDFLGYLSKRNRFLFSDNESLKDLVDIYTGMPIKYQEPMVAAANSLLPIFKQNGGMEPWRQWLLSTGWDGLSTMRVNTINGSKLTPSDRQYINNWVAHYGGLKGKIIELMNHPDGFWNKQIKAYKKSRGLKKQEDYPIKQLLLHKLLDQIHDEAFDHAIGALAVRDEEYVHEGRMKRYRDSQLNKGNVGLAEEAAEELLQFQ